MRNTKQSKQIPCYELPIRLFLASAKNNVRIACDRFGNVSSNSENHQEWVILPDNSSSSSTSLPGVILLKSLMHGYYLGSNEYGQTICIRKDKKEEEKVNEEDKWIISPSPHSGTFFLSSYLYRRNLAIDEYGYIFTIEPHEGSGFSSLDASWNIDFQSGELCFIHSPEYHKRLRCNLTGNVSITDNYEGWEIWRFIEASGCNNEVYISSWAHEDKFLSSDVDGNVFCTSSENNSRTSSERWIIEKDYKYGRNGVIIKSAAYSRFLHCVIDTADGNNIIETSDQELTLKTLETYEEESALWQLSEGHRNNFLLSSVHNDKRLSAPKNDVVCTSNNRKKYEHWKIEFFPDGFCTIYSPKQNKYLSSNSNGVVSISSNANEWEKWRIEETSFGEYYIYSVVHKRYLACNNNIKDGELYTSNTYDDICEMWYIEPNMPRRFTKQNIIALSVAGAVGLSTAMVMPIAVVALVRGIGFTAGGIAAGSTAATMMSGEAIASGAGVVTAGGVVATLQSVGVAGLGVAGTTAAIGSGALVGTTIVGATAERTLNVTDVTPNENVVVCSNRPFCGWKSWSK